jgi:homoserine kinase
MSFSESDKVSVFAPASLSNLGPGFDVFGLALEGLGDVVTAHRSETSGVVLEGVEGDGGLLPGSASENTAGVAAFGVLDLLKQRLGKDPGGVVLHLTKGTPLASGLGSSAASAAAAARAVWELFPDVISEEDLLGPCLEAEAAVSGRHLDNVAPSLLGGFVLVQGVDPIRVHRLPFEFDLQVVVVKPAFGLPTREARAALPEQVPLKDAVANLADATTMVHALYKGDRELFLDSMRDRLVEPVRAGMISGATRVWSAAAEAGAVTVGVSGAGPTLFAMVTDPGVGETVGESMRRAWEAQGIDSRVWVTRASGEGARRVQ